MTTRISSQQEASLVGLFSDPLTAADYSQKSGIRISTARQDVARYLAQGRIFEAGKVRLPRGAPAMRYCNDERKAMLESLRNRPEVAEGKPNKLSQQVVSMKFASKTALKHFVQAILHRERSSAWVDSTELEFLKALLTRHPDAKTKMGRGVKGVWVGLNDYGKPTFFLQRTDDTTTDFSFLKCVFPQQESTYSGFRKACRSAVDAEVFAFKQAAFEGKATIVCPVSGEVISFSQAHVDHIPPDTFEALVNRFVNEKKVSVYQAIEGHEDGSMALRFADPEFEALWVEFHRQNARLRVISAHANLSTVRETT